MSSNQNSTFRCASCDEVHTGLFDIACLRPEQWQDSEEYEPNSTVSSSTHFLSEDFCVLNGEHFFVRCILELPLIGRPGEKFAYGVWSTLSKANFESYLVHFDTGCDNSLGPWHGWFSNRLKGYPDTLNLKCHVLPRPDRQRPLVRLQDEAHPLAVEARDGIGLDRLVTIYSEYGHDVSLAALRLH